MKKKVLVLFGVICAFVLVSFSLPYLARLLRSEKPERSMQLLTLTNRCSVQPSDGPDTQDALNRLCEETGRFPLGPFSVYKQYVVVDVIPGEHVSWSVYWHPEKTAGGLQPLINNGLLWGKIEADFDKAAGVYRLRAYHLLEDIRDGKTLQAGSAVPTELSWDQLSANYESKSQRVHLALVEIILRPNVSSFDVDVTVYLAARDPQRKVVGMVRTFLGKFSGSTELVDPKDSVKLKLGIPIFHR